MAQVTGIITLTIAQKRMRVKSGAKFSPGGKKRTTVSADEVVGFSEEPAPSSIDCTLVHMSDSDIAEASNWKDVEVLVETDTGLKYTIPQAWTMEPCQLTGGGDMSLKMEGKPAA